MTNKGRHSPHTNAIISLFNPRNIGYPKEAGLPTRSEVLRLPILFYPKTVASYSTMMILRLRGQCRLCTDFPFNPILMSA
ncbi:hypothetical protein HQ34_09845 [Porphyromonas cangingivalis]|nr:hypothetical protein HQ34_09845 [Porphyromonas cangingivalis]